MLTTNINSFIKRKLKLSYSLPLLNKKRFIQLSINRVKTDKNKLLSSLKNKTPMLFLNIEVVVLNLYCFIIF